MVHISSGVPFGTGDSLGCSLLYTVRSRSISSSSSQDIPCLKWILKHLSNEQYTMEALKPILTEYAEITRKLNEVNARSSELRDERRTVELDLAALYATSSDALPDKISLATSGMTFAVKYPNQWKKGWTLSKKELKAYLDELIPQRSEALMLEIVKRQEEKMVESDYGFELKVATKRD